MTSSIWRMFAPLCLCYVMQNDGIRLCNMEQAIPLFSLERLPHRMWLSPNVVVQPTIGVC
jgi:hypothetical protein